MGYIRTMEFKSDSEAEMMATEMFNALLLCVSLVVGGMAMFCF
jgi:hypothetical protein